MPSADTVGEGLLNRLSLTASLITHIAAVSESLDGVSPVLGPGFRPGLERVGGTFWFGIPPCQLSNLLLPRLKSLLQGGNDAVLAKPRDMDPVLEQPVPIRTAWKVGSALQSFANRRDALAKASADF